jgi:hypothetical protein
MSILKFILLSLSSLLLSACGGGGGDSASNTTTTNPVVIPPPQSIQAAKAWDNLLKVGGSWTLEGSDSLGNKYQQTLVVTLGPEKSYSEYNVPKGPFNTALISSTTLKNSINVGSKTQELYFTKDTNEVKFGRVSSPLYCFQSVVSYPVIDTAILNSGGSLFSATKFSSCINLGSDGSTSASWSYQAENEVPFFCVKIDSENTCVDVNSSGQLGKKMKIVTPSLTLKNY